MDQIMGLMKGKVINMAFGAVQQFPNDLRPRVGIGVNLPFSEGGVYS